MSVKLGKMLAADARPLDPWDPKLELLELDPNLVRFGRGFLAGQPAQWFSPLAQHWIPFLHGSGIDVSVVSIEPTLHFPEDLEHLTVFEIDGEPAVLGYSEQAEKVISSGFVQHAGGQSESVLLEYLERRLFTTLSNACQFADPIICNFLPNSPTEEVEVVGGIQLTLRWNGKSLEIWFGLGVRTVEKLDNYARKMSRQQLVESGKAAFGDEIFVVTAEIAQLSVPPSLLIDYTRVGAKIELPVAAIGGIDLLLNGQPWAEGVLRQFHEMLAVEITAFSSTGANSLGADAPSRLSVEVARIELDEAALAEYQQVGAILLTNIPLNGKVQLVFGGERVAEAVLGKSLDNFALTVTPR